MQKTNYLSQKWIYWLLIFALIAGIFFRLINVDRKVYWNDEAITSMRAGGYSQIQVIQEVYKPRLISVAEIMKYQDLKPGSSELDTIDSLATEAPMHTPLFFIIERWWMHWFSNSITAMRSLSVLMSLLVFPCLYWLCIELFESELASWISIAVVAISPLHLLYAQEARPYSFWALMTVLSSAMLLRALQSQTKLSWLGYTATLIVGLYSYTFFVFVVIVQGIYILSIKDFRTRKVLVFYSLSLGTAILAFIAWLLIIINPASQISNSTWHNNPISLIALINQWGINLNRVLFDIPNLGDYAFPFILVLVAYAFYFVLRNSHKNTYFFILCLVATSLFLIIPDIILGGKRSILPRYFIPCYLGIELAISYLLYKKISGRFVKINERNFWHFVLVAILSIGIISCTIISHAPTWWTKYSSYYNDQISNVINSASDSLVITDTGPARILSLCRSLNPEIQLLLLKNSDTLKIPDRFSNIFLFEPSYNLLNRPAIQKKYKVKAEVQDLLWKIQP